MPDYQQTEQYRASNGLKYVTTPKVKTLSLSVINESGCYCFISFSPNAPSGALSADRIVPPFTARTFYLGGPTPNFSYLFSSSTNVSPLKPAASNQADGLCTVTYSPNPINESTTPLPSSTQMSYATTLLTQSYAPLPFATRNKILKPTALIYLTYFRLTLGQAPIANTQVTVTQFAPVSGPTNYLATRMVTNNADFTAIPIQWGPFDPAYGCPIDGTVGQWLDVFSSSADLPVADVEVMYAS